jgi:hypothetical protein
MSKKSEPAKTPEVQPTPVPTPAPAVEPQPTVPKIPLVWEAVAAISFPGGDAPPSQQGCSGVAYDWEHAAIGAMRHFNRKFPGANVALIKVAAIAEVSFTNI